MSNIHDIASDFEQVSAKFKSSEKSITHSIDSLILQLKIAKEHVEMWTDQDEYKGTGTGLSVGVGLGVSMDIDISNTQEASKVGEYGKNNQGTSNDTSGKQTQQEELQTQKDANMDKEKVEENNDDEAEILPTKQSTTMSTESAMDNNQSPRQEGADKDKDVKKAVPMVISEHSNQNKTVMSKAEILKRINATLKQEKSTVLKAQKEINSALTKLSKSVERFTLNDVEKCIPSGVIKKKTNLNTLPNSYNYSHAMDDTDTDDVDPMMIDANDANTRSAMRNHDAGPENSDVHTMGNLNVGKMNEAVAVHIFREGWFDLGETFVAEAKDIQIDPKVVIEPFRELHSVLQGLRNKQLDPAIAWAKERRDILLKQSSFLEFRLHQLQFFKILQEQDRIAAVNYAKKHFPDFASSQLTVIRRCMASLVFADDLENSPYADLVSPSQLMDVENQFRWDCCRCLGFSKESPLYKVVVAGCEALPILLKASRIMPGKAEWTSSDQLPVEIYLGEEYNYHSIFACPVSREESTVDNPPMILPCGHVLCKASINRLPRGNLTFKCPYCPSEQTPSQCSEIKF